MQILARLWMIGAGCFIGYVFLKALKEGLGFKE